jgi:ribosome-associated toxin RatA of RatAB toxin-antitoxin module
MAHAEFRDVMAVDAQKLIQVITEYQKYPEFLEGCHSVQVKPADAAHSVRVSYEVSVMSQNVSYTLDHHEDKARGQVVWELVESNFFKKNVGRWEVKSLGPNQSEALYSIEVEFKVPVPGFILNRLVKGSLPSLVKSFEKRARNI